MQYLNWADWIIPWKTMLCGQMVEWKWHESPAVWILQMAKFHVALAKQKFCIMNLIAGGRSHMYNLFSGSTWTPSSRRCSSLLIPSALLLMCCSVSAVQLESKWLWWIHINFYISLSLVYHDVQGQSKRSVSATFWYIIPPPQGSGFVLSIIPKWLVKQCNM